MADSITRYKVFIASPGGLQDERQAFRDTIREYNEEIDQQRRDVTFMPVGWEETLGGHGRPQSLINEDIIACDYFILLLWDRWGSPPDTPGQDRYSSACEEEFALALECLENPAKPMREVLIFFKAVAPAQLADPGPQLSQVLDFKRQLEREKMHFFTTFDEMAVFQQQQRRHLAKWVHAHEAGRDEMVA